MSEEATSGNPWPPNTPTLRSISKAAFELGDYWRIVEILHKRFNWGVRNHCQEHLEDVTLTQTTMKIKKTSPLPQKNVVDTEAAKSAGQQDDLDESQQLQECESSSKVTLSGLLNFVDGLWSSCGDERIIVFTTNHKEKLDPALLRPGRMDVHIHMSYCTPYGFRQLASNYLGIKEHTLFEEIDDAIKETKVTPAEVAEQLLKYSDIEIILKELLEFLRKKKEKQTIEAEMKEQVSKENERKTCRCQ